MRKSTTDLRASRKIGRGAPAPRPFSYARPFAPAVAAVALTVLLVQPALAAAPVFEATPVQPRNAPLMAPPGALAEPAEGESAAPDPLVSDEGVAASGSAAVTVGAAASVDAGATTAAPRAARADSATASYRPPSFEGGAAVPAGTVSGDVPADAAGVLYAQLQDLQQEVMMLRGVVESQQKTIERMERDQRERYLDLDRRLARGGAVGSAAAGGSLNPDSASAPLGATVAGAPDERSAYDAAFALTREKRFAEAIPAFRSLIVEYPGGQYVPNSWYWLGELYLALPEPDLEQARQAFVQVAQQHPRHRKAPDALFKLGIVYDRLGEKDQARLYLERALAEYPGSEAARLADTYIRQQL